jgi:ABC-type lipoprotein release transport system permease subunit
MTMKRRHLALRGLAYYWRTNLAVVAGVATAVAVLAGALLVGESVRASLRALVADRLGRADHAVVAATFFREALSGELARDPRLSPRFSSVAPLLVAQGFVTAQESGRRVGSVAVYGVDDRFWRLHGLEGVGGPGERDALLSPALAGDLEIEEGATLLVRLQRPSDVPIESLHARKDDLGRTVRVTVRRVLPRATVGEFSLRPQQGEVRAVFVPLSRLQQDLEIPGRVNTILAALAAAQPPAEERAGATAALQQVVRERASLDDAGLRVRALPAAHAVAIEAAAGVLDARQEAAARAGVAAVNRTARPLFTYLANTMRIGDREVPYSLVSAVEGTIPFPPWSAGTDAPVVLNDWAARDLDAQVGDRLTMDYYLWEDPGRLTTASADFTVAAIVPIASGDREMAPEYPGISDSTSIDDWDPPFPVDLRRVRPQDEAYWNQYRTTPKAFVPLEVGQRLWRSRYGAVTSIRVPVEQDASLDEVQRRVADAVRARVDPLTVGLAVRDVRAEALAASRGATDFGEYFVYFSFFLVVSALLLASLFFKLGIEQRVREVGLLRSVGFRGADVRRMFLLEGVVLALAGVVLGLAGALAYAWLIMAGLRTWWVDAVGTTALSVHVGVASLAGGAAGALVAALACIWWTLRGLSHVTERSLLAGELAVDTAAPRAAPRRRGWIAAAALAAAALGLLAAGALGAIDAAGAFFGAGALLLGAALTVVAQWARRPVSRPLAGRGWASVSRLGARNVGYRPGRMVLSVAVVAAAAFILVTVGSFRRAPTPSTTERASGTGGYSVMVETLLPVVHDLDTAAGRDAISLTLPGTVRLEPFRVLPGDDASCLNLYAPSRPRILGARASFLREGRFVFQSTVDTANDAERANPWLLLERRFADGAIPVIADANSLTYVLHTPVGSDFVIDDSGRPLRLRVVAALRDSVLQGEFIMAEAAFLRAFPAQQGYGLLLADAPPELASTIVSTIEDVLVDFGADARPTRERLDEYHRVENTYLSTFQTLGGLGLLLGTVGVAAVLLRNVLERRRELALLGAVGYSPAHFLLMAFVENVMLIGGGLLVGGASAWIAVAPALAERGARAPVGAGGLVLLLAVLVTGLISAAVATRAATAAPLLESLRSE